MSANLPVTQFSRSLTVEQNTCNELPQLLVSRLFINQPTKQGTTHQDQLGKVFDFKSEQQYGSIHAPVCQSTPVTGWFIRIDQKFELYFSKNTSWELGDVHFCHTRSNLGISALLEILQSCKLDLKVVLFSELVPPTYPVQLGQNWIITLRGL